MNENVTLDGYFDEAREYIEANAKNEIQTERLSAYMKNGNTAPKQWIQTKMQMKL